MRIALIHYHLHAGGVTTVVRRQADLLTAAGHEVLLVSGEAPPSQWSAPVAVVPGLAYDQPGRPKTGVDGIATELMAVMRRRWPGGDPDLIHVHNPILAKNRHLQELLARLQAAGLRLLCQVHDFAEDGRPDAYFDAPYLSDCHYAVVNGRDRRLLIAAGLSDQGVHYLPNAIPPIPWPASPTDSREAPVLYPVRAIRRKNIGEAILLRLFMPMQAPLTITLPPHSPRDLPGYRLWRALAARERLPVVFDAGLRNPFPDLMAGCAYVLTTSITEGFGFTFLEPWGAGKAVWGRNLPDICDDFSSKAIRLDHLYDHLWVPLSWLDRDALARRWCAARRNAAGRYGRPCSEDAPRFEWARLTGDGRIDFGLLDEPFQQAVIERLLMRVSARQELMALNPFLRSPGPPADTAALIRHNRRMVACHFDPVDYCERLTGIYRSVIDQPVRQAIDKQTLLSHFLTPERFSLLKWRALDG